MAWILHSYADNRMLVGELASVIGRLLESAVQERGRASLAVSGGSTPRTLFEALSRLDLPWQQVTVTLVDERWVDEDDTASNAGLVRQALLQNRAAAAHFVGLKTEADSPFSAVAAVDRRLRESVLDGALVGEAVMEKQGVLDVALLGMGEDGHVASFLPGARGLSAALARDPTQHCAAIEPPEPALPRMTLTLGALLQARHLLLHFIGPAKYAVLQEALREGPQEELPVRAVLQRQHPLEIYYAEAI